MIVAVAVQTRNALGLLHANVLPQANNNTITTKNKVITDWDRGCEGTMEACLKAAGEFVSTTVTRLYTWRPQPPGAQSL